MKYLLLLLISFLAHTQEICLEGEKNCMLESSVSSPKLNNSLNLIGRSLATCSKDPITGFYRSGKCESDERDQGNHSVCTTLTAKFLDFTKSQGNDLSTPNPRYGFPGLKPGDSWCLCAARWLEAKMNGINLDVNINATSQRAYLVTNEFDFQWKYHVLKCTLKEFEKQKAELNKNKQMSEELKLIVIPDSKAKECKLIGLDGTLKKTSKDFFKLTSLKKIINKMPMRQAKLKNN